MALPSALFQRGVRASQPAATAVAAGTTYIVTDESNKWERSNGSTWDNITPSAASGSFRGALVTKASDQNAANYSSDTAIAWDSEAYDTDAIHSTVTNTTRLSVPSGVTKVRLSAGLLAQSVTANAEAFFQIKKNNSAAFAGYVIGVIDTSATQVSGVITTPVLAVTGGTDYFEAVLSFPADSSVNIIANGSWFAMEIIE